MRYERQAMGLDKDWGGASTSLKNVQAADSGLDVFRICGHRCTACKFSISIILTEKYTQMISDRKMASNAFVIQTQKNTVPDSLSRELTDAFGKGFSRSNLQNMRLLYLSCSLLASPRDSNSRSKRELSICRFSSRTDHAELTVSFS